MMAVSKALRASLLGILALVASLGLASAQGTSVSLGVQDYDSTSPVEITSDELAIDQSSGTATFTGNVLVGQGDIRMTCGRMVVEYGQNEATGKTDIKVIRMFDGVTFVSQKEAAEANSAVYSLEDGSIIMAGNVLLTQGATALSSDRLTYNLNTGSGVMEGSVKTILQPDSN